MLNPSFCTFCSWFSPHTFSHLVPSTAVFQQTRLPFLADHWFSFSVPSTPTKTPMVKKIPPVPPQFWFSPSGTDYEFHLFIWIFFGAQTHGSYLCTIRTEHRNSSAPGVLPQKLATYILWCSYIPTWQKSQCHPIFCPEYFKSKEARDATIRIWPSPDHHPFTLHKKAV